MCVWQDIVNANKTIKTTDIKGKNYAEVNQRIKAFRSVFPTGNISTELVALENGICTFKAVVSDGEGRVLGTGHAQEKETSSFINKTSYIENCETSAVGRALGMCGFGIDTSVASFEEVANAIENQSKTPRQQLLDELEAQGIDAKEFGKKHGLSRATTDEEYLEVIASLKVDTTSFSPVPPEV